MMNTNEYLVKAAEREVKEAAAIKQVKRLTRKVNKQKEQLKQVKSELQDAWYSLNTLNKAACSRIWNSDGDLRLALEA
jgi:seryl-tRNA synthetase